MIPRYGPDCDLCLPSVHYLLTCSKGHEWDEPPTPGEFECPHCGEEVTVTDDEDKSWRRDVIGLKE